MTLKLSKFTPEQQFQLNGLFYKIGIWMSHADDAGETNDASDLAEEAQLFDVLEKMAKTYKAFPLIMEMADNAVSQSGYHEKWKTDSDGAVAEAAIVAGMIKTMASKDELAAFKGACMQVATDVAKAYQEDEYHTEVNHGMDYDVLVEKVANFFARISNRKLYEEMNISPAEDNALSELANALRNV
ncbi:MAG: hypothetical protein CL565_06675 [Alphaproteobacteria bacterium]|nr:hypothetical protein [Alphaproteobacteria bacterium]